ncbi:F-box protein interaction domain protein [Medicago truncatula]|uniref:F-box protein interaction domain protein n=1 Tax=Medicago truncatula TaxID=3880 RepID=A0A072TZK0_MEDTR|nr:F-box protein interaction domain protein [Medicago truncatula]
MHFITWNPLGLRATQLRFITWNTTEKNYTRMAKMKETLYLPSELIIQILLRLPVKSLLCFKCICKSWLSLISDPHFANSHVDVSAAKIVSISRTRPLAEIRFIDFETSINHDSVSLDHSFLLPKGFGYDGLRDDYLVVLLSYDPTLVKTSSYLEFFSLRDNKWNEIEGPHITYLNATANRKAGGSFFNGAIHWLASPYHKIPLEVIVVFDLMERKLLEIPLPDDYDHGPEHYGLWVFGKFLSLWNMNFDNRTVEIWEMKEYKQQSSWTKTLVIPIDNDIPWFSPVYSTKSGDIIGTSNIGLGLVKYNNKGQLLEYFAMNSIASEVAMYTESLLSLPGGP